MRWPSFAAVFLLGCSAVHSATFTTVYEWDVLDLAWPSEVDRTKAIENGTYIPQNIEPRYLAAYKDRLFLTLQPYYGIPATLVSLSTSSASSAPPQLVPFPNWQSNERTSCNNILRAKGVRVDGNGHLWVVDEGSSSDNCSAKLLIFNLADGDKNVLVHPFSPSTSKAPRAIVVDQTEDNEQFAYITDFYKEQIVAFSLKTNESWPVKTPLKSFYALALSTQGGAKRLYLTDGNSNKLYSIAVAELTEKDRTPELTYIGQWSESTNGLLINNNANVLYATFYDRKYISAWNIAQPFTEEQHFYEPAYGGTDWLFNLDLDPTTGTFWIVQRNDVDDKRRFKLLKASVGSGNSTSTAGSSVQASSSSAAPGSVL